MFLGNRWSLLMAALNLFFLEWSVFHSAINPPPPFWMNRHDREIIHTFRIENKFGQFYQFTYIYMPLYQFVSKLWLLILLIFFLINAFIFTNTVLAFYNQIFSDWTFPTNLPLSNARRLNLNVQFAPFRN